MSSITESSHASVARAGSLTDRAMLVDLTIKQWTAAKHDRNVTREVAQMHGSDASMGRYNKLLIARAGLEKLRQVGRAAGQEHRRRTLPWLDSGPRILSSDGYFGYTEAMRRFEAEWDDAVDEFDHGYPMYVDDARCKLNGLFRPEDYPAPHCIRDRFAFGYNFFPLPSSHDFRVQLGDAETARVQASIQSQLNQALDAAIADVWRRMQTVVEHMLERLRAYSVSAEGVTGKFHDTLVDNVRQLVDILPSLNITGNAAIAEVTERMRAELCCYAAPALRSSTDKRERTAAAAESILNHIQAFAA